LSFDAGLRIGRSLSTTGCLVRHVIDFAGISRILATLTAPAAGHEPGHISDSWAWHVLGRRAPRVPDQVAAAPIFSSPALSKRAAPAG